MITKLSNEKVDDVGDIRSEISRLQSPQNVPIELIRGHKPVTVQAALGAVSGATPRGSLRVTGFTEISGVHRTRVTRQGSP